MEKEIIFEILEEANAAEIDEYLDAALNRKRELYPGWEICYMALPKETEEERKALDDRLSALLWHDTKRQLQKYMRKRCRRCRLVHKKKK